MNPSGLTPLEYNCIIQLDPIEEKTAGGIIVPVAKVERDELAAEEGTLVAMSPVAFDYAEFNEPPQIGDRVLFARYSGILHERNGIKFRIVKDKSVIATITPQPALAAVA